MGTITPSSDAIINVNTALNNILKQYLNSDSSNAIDIRFDLPDVNSKQPAPTISVFLYDVHEDLQLRQSDAARFSVKSSQLRAGYVNLNCSYLITYWEGSDVANDGNAPDSRPDNQAAKVMTLILHALLTSRELPGVEGSYTRVIPPQENLNSLGNFWQSLGNRPRLSLLYCVTVPLLLDNSVPQPLVTNVSSKVSQVAAVDTSTLHDHLWRLLCTAVGTDATQQLARVKLACETVAADNNNSTAQTLNCTLTGVVNTTCKNPLEALLKQWQDSKQAVTEINGAQIYIAAVNADALVYVQIAE